MKKTQHPLRLLLLADSHLGFDLPTHPRIDRRRRGKDFLANHRRALEPALRGEVELVVHGGDLFHRPRVPPSLAFQAFQPLLEVAEAGVPVFVVPGNHERARIPHDRFASHPNLHIFREPSTRRVCIGGADVALSGIPFQRRGVRKLFPGILRDTGWKGVEADLRLLCTHHCVEGATVGPSDYTFRNAPDVIRCSDLPAGFAAVLSGHIHRHQVLRRDLQGRRLVTPVFYPGSVERTAFAEAGEEKGFLIIEARPGPKGGEVVGEAFHPLPTRPMEVRDLAPGGGPEGSWLPGEMASRLQKLVEGIPPDCVFQLRVQGKVPEASRSEVSAASLREASPREMNLQLILAQDRGARVAGRGSGGNRRRNGGKERTQFELPL